MVFCRIMHNHIKFLWLQVEYLLHRAWERGGVFAPFLPSSPSTLIKACPLLWHASSYMSKESPFLLDLFSICESHSATLRQQEMNQRPVCICIGDIGLGTTVWKTTKQKNKSAKSTGIERNPLITLWEHTNSLEWHYVLSFSISPLNWLQHLIDASKILRRWQMNTTHFFHHLKVIRIRALHAPEAN